jgi:hypothetical protein
MEKSWRRNPGAACAQKFVIVNVWAPCFDLYLVRRITARTPTVEHCWGTIYTRLNPRI